MKVFVNLSNGETTESIKRKLLRIQRFKGLYACFILTIGKNYNKKITQIYYKL